MAYTPEQIEQFRIANNIPANSVVVQTTSGGFVFVDPSRQDVINAYASGQLTGGPEESAIGVQLRVLPPPPPPPTPPTIGPPQIFDCRRFDCPEGFDCVQTSDVLIRDPSSGVLSREGVFECVPIELPPPPPQQPPSQPTFPQPPTQPTFPQSTPPATPQPTPPATPQPTPPATPRASLQSIPTPTVQNFSVPIVVIIIPAPIPLRFENRIVINITPEETPSQTLPFTYPINITTLPININVSTPIIYLARQFIEAALAFYIDEERELKTLVNYGNDRQSVALAWRPGQTERSIQLKLLQPIPDTIDLTEPVFLSREVAKTLVDILRVRFAPPIIDTPYLRPLNVDVSTNKLVGKSLRNKTLQLLRLQTGSIGSLDTVNNISFEDQVFRQWYSYDFNSSELNLDFTNYDNFIFYSSAYLRLQAFRQKLRQLEQLDARRIQFINGSVFTGSLALAGATYIQEQGALLARQKEDIIRGFDRYEQYLYFTESGSVSAYSASFDYVDGGVEYNPIGYWPKSGSGLWPVDSFVASEWFTSQSAIAQRFDEFNENNLLNTIPTHVREHEENAAYITFVSMIGHFFDTIKPYIDQFPNIYSRYSDPNVELSKDLISPVVESFGFPLPAINTLNSVEDTVLSIAPNIARRDYTVETYKRLLHNLPLFSKAKGTKTALNAMIRSLGFGPSVIAIRETGRPHPDAYIEREEYTQGLQFDSAVMQYITLPFSSSLRDPQTLQYTLRMKNPENATLVTGDESWALYITLHPEDISYGRFELDATSFSTPVTSSYRQLFNNTSVNVTLQSDKLYVFQTDGSDLLFNESVTLPSSFFSDWTDTTNVYFGGSGSLRTTGYGGILDDVRLWNIRLSENIISTNAFDPGATIGTTFKSPAENLLVKLSFDQVDVDQLISQSVLINETPYFARFDTPSIASIEVTGFTTNSFVRYDRTVRQSTPLIGATDIVSNKIRVLPPPVFDRWARTKDGVPKLSHTKSIVLPEEKRLRAGKNRILLSLSPTNAINNSIIRAVGQENINNFTGLPPKLFRVFSRSFREFKLYYNLFYKNTVNYNQYIRTVGDIASSVNQIIDYFIPAKATILKGIVIEPSIIERTLIPLEKTIRLYGKNSRKTLHAVDSLSTRFADYGATFNLEKNIPAIPAILSGSSPTFNVKLKNVLAIPTILDGNAPLFNAEIKNVALTEISGSTPTLTTQIDTEFTEEITANSQLISDELSLAIETLSATPMTVNAVCDEPIFDVRASYASYTSSLALDGLNPTGSFLTQTGVLPIPIPSEIDGTADTVFDVTPVDARVPVSKTANYVVYTLQHEYVPSVKSKQVRIDMGLASMNKIKSNATNKGSLGAEPYNRVYPRKLFDQEISFPRIGGTTSLNPSALYEIRPSTDFIDPGVTTFFDNPEGVYLFPETELQPSYVRPLDISTATTWSYGTRYNLNDIVFQQVTRNDVDDLGKLVTTARGGNGRYYVYKTRAEYGPPLDGTRYVSGSIPSYIPPSLDQDSWDLLRFTPVEKRVPRRIVFDTFITKIPSLNNFKVTTIDIQQVVDVPTRYLDALNIPRVISANGQLTGDVILQNMLNMLAVQSNTPNIRLRLYRTEESRDADLLRTSTTFPTGSHGVLLDVVLNTTNTVTLTNPIPTIVADSIIPAGRIFYTVDNLESTIKTNISVLLYYYALQIEPRVPRGYLRKHYRFFRTNSTGIKRHSYIGCKNTVDTTVDGLPPVQVFISEGNTLTVAPSRLSTEIITGGGGTLDVT
jgi:hypothetical protein